jgi:hypothetical protein
MRTSRWIFGCLAAAVLSAACSGGDNPTSTGNPGTGPTPPTPHVRTVVLDANSIAMNVGSSRQVNATVTADSGFTGSLGVTWSTSNAAIAAVTAGRVDGVAAGSATITARSIADTSIAASVAVTVTTPPPPPPDACAPIGLSVGQTVQGSFNVSCVISGLGTARQYTVALTKSTAFWASLSPAQSLAVGFDLDHAATVSPNAATTALVTYAVLLPAGTPKIAVYGGSGNFSMTVDTTVAGMQNAQNCVLIAPPNVNASVTLARACTTVDVYFAWTATKQLTLTAQHPSITPAVQLLVNGTLLAIGTPDDAAHRSTLALLPSAGQFIRVALNGADPNVANAVTLTISQ